MEEIAHILKKIKLKTINENTFIGYSHDIKTQRIYGGQILAQSLEAATKTVHPNKKVNSFHAYFLIQGQIDSPIYYKVERLREGKDFSTREINAIQDDKIIYKVLASFSINRPSFEHQVNFPKVPSAENLINETDYYQLFIKNSATKNPMISRLYTISTHLPAEFRPVTHLSLKKENSESHRQVWFKFNGKLEDNSLSHKNALVYISDYNLVTTTLLPHLNIFLNAPNQYYLTTLDHAMWFYKDFEFNDQWFLYEQKSPILQNSRGLIQGTIFSQKGDLLASVCQECLIRKR